MNAFVWTAADHLGAAQKPNFDNDTVTPGVIGFIITFAVAVATVLLVIDMVHRVRRTRYRGEIRERIEAERIEAEREAEQTGSSGTARKDAPPVPPPATR